MRIGNRDWGEDSPGRNDRREERALTLVEALVVISVIGFMVLILLPALVRPHNGHLRINCSSNLKQVGLAFRIWEGDNGDHYPMSVYTNAFGQPLYTNASNAFRYFQVMSNELNNPKVLACPTDKSRWFATNFTTDLNSTHVGYFIGLDADETRPKTFLAGDSNITNDKKTKSGMLEVTTNQIWGWTKDRHANARNMAGNIALADGSVQMLYNENLSAALQITGMVTNRLLVP